MKTCPKCNTDYFDNMLEFCLEDGERLLYSSKTQDEKATITQSASKNPATAKTVSLPFSAPGAPVPPTQNVPSTPKISATKQLETRVKTKSFEVLQIAPIIISLLHNWVQWLYLSNHKFSTIGEFLISPNFLVWFVLLICGAILGVLAVKYCEKKGFGYVSLVVLAINLLLFLVPER